VNLSDLRHFGIALLLAACTAHAPGAVENPKPPTPALPADAVVGLDAVLAALSEAALRQHVETLASDAFHGRAPGTEGEEVTLAYLEQQLARSGFAPAGDAGSYRQAVALIGARASAEASGRAGREPITLRAPEDFVAHTLTGKPDVHIDGAELVFVGYGVRAPEYEWDDYEGIDAKGKLLVMLVGDPPVPDAARPGELDPAVFAGRAMTYYGRWTYKFEMAGKLGARGVLLVHDTYAAGYGYDVVKSGAEKELLALADDRTPLADVQGWLSSKGAERLFAQAGLDFASLKEKAKTRDAAPVLLDARLSVRVRSTLRRFTSHNIVAKLPGSDPRLAAQAVVLSAHWDHFGESHEGAGDRVFNGAVDNASGVGTMLELARALGSLNVKPRRSIVVLAPTAEEAGLLGARHYAQHPAVPLADTVADINMDCMNLWGRARALVSIGVGTSSLDAVLAAEAARAGRQVTPDPEPEKGYFFRSDHLELMKRGVPALHFLHPGDLYEGLSAAQSAALRARYVREDYHKVTDQAGPALRYDGALDDARLLARLVLDVSEADARPRFTSGPSLMPKAD
jgi:Zn-dependent M28 family amino/carboxypeptidase